MIDSPDNPKVKLMRSLEDARGVREHGLFVVEGVRLVEDGLAAGLWPALCLYEPSLLARTSRGRSLMARLASGEGSGRAAALEASNRALQAAANTPHPQGVVAAFNVPTWTVEGLGQDESALLVLCDRIQDPGNLGTIFRTAEAAGARAVVLTPGCAFAFSPKVVRSGMGSHFRLPLMELEWPEVPEALRSLGLSPADVVASDAGSSLPYDAVNWTRGACVIVSNEAHGLSPEARELSAKGRTVTIPMEGHTESLNASAAAAVILFEAARQRRNARTARGPEAPRE
jgi:TrmH family RNA methyltransferase